MAAELGEALPPPPAGLDGSRLGWPPVQGIAAPSCRRPATSALIVARAVAPTAYSSGIPFETARDYLLSLPAFPTTSRRSCAASPAMTTLPLPCPTSG